MKTLNVIFLITLLLTSGYGRAEAYNRNANIYELLDRIEKLQNEVRQLRGTVEEQTYKISTLESRQQAMYLDFGQHLQALAKTSEPVIEQEDDSIVEPKDKDELIDTVLTASETRIEPLLEESAVITETASILDDAEPISEPARTLYKRPVIEQKQAFQQAYEMLRTGASSDSITLFTQFLQDYPRGVYADQASYWLAEAYQLNQQPDLARLTFQNIVNQFANSPKVPDAKLKLAYIAADFKNYAQARQQLINISNSYSGTIVAYLAAQKLKELPSTKGRSDQVQ